MPKSAPRTSGRAPTRSTCSPGTSAHRSAGAAATGHFLIRFCESAVGKKWRHGGQRGHPARLRPRPHGRQAQGVPRRRASSTGTPSGCARSASPPSRAPSCCGACASGSSLAFVFHILAAYQLTRIEPQGPAGEVPVAARLRRRQLRVAHDALDGRHRRPLPHLPPARPDVGPRQPRLRPRRPVRQPLRTASSGVPVAIVYIVANIALGIHIFHGVVERCSRASGSTTRATTSGGATSPPGFAARHHRRLREHAAPRRHAEPWTQSGARRIGRR